MSASLRQLWHKARALRPYPPYRAGPRLERAIREHLELPRSPRWLEPAMHLPESLFRQLKSRDQSLRGIPPLRQTYYDFAISTNQRGRDTFELLAPLHPIERARVLDIGCAYGGFLVAAIRSGAAHGIGIDIDERLIRLAGENLLDHEIVDRVELLTGDILEDPLPPELGGEFDIVICNDVIEHVLDPHKLARRVVELLRPDGGLAYLEIPNRRSSLYLEADGHYHLFGINVLEEPDARALYHCFFPDQPYTVGFLYDLDVYAGWFEQLGARVELLPYPRAADALERGARQYAKYAADAQTWSPKEVPEKILQTVRACSQRFHDDFELDRAQVDSGGVEVDDFLRRYYDPFWRVAIVCDRD